MDTKTLILSVLLALAIVIAIAGTYYQTIVLESFEYYLEETADSTSSVTE